MRNLLILFGIIHLSLSLAGQGIPTVGEVYDFAAGDEFHVRTADEPPNCRRFIINSKFFSASGDTVFYIRFNDNYSSEWLNQPVPHLEYYFYSYVDTVSFTCLDSLISSPFFPLLNDTLANTFFDTVYNSLFYCNRPVYELDACSNCIFEGIHFHQIYGRGLGILSYLYEYAAQNVSNYYFTIFYRKNGIPCGLPDLTTQGIADSVNPDELIHIYPNPFSEFFTVDLLNQGSVKMSIFSITGEVIRTWNTEGPQTIKIQNLAPGSYFLKINIGREIVTRRLFCIL